MRNPHAGVPFGDDDEAIAVALEDMNVPALLCSLVHMSGDPSWIVRPKLPELASATDYQCGLSAAEQADIRRRALAVIAAYRDHGCEPHPLASEVLLAMMSFMARKPLEGRIVPMLFEDMQFDGEDSRAVRWADDVPDEVRAASPVVVIGCGESGILAGIRLSQAGLPFVILDKNDGPGGTWWENRYPGARVDVGSHQYCYSFEPADHWSEYYCRQPELRDYFATVLEKYRLRPHCRFGTTVTAITWDESSASWRVDVKGPDGTADVLDARFVVSAVGSLNLPKLPDIPGMDTYSGPSFHSSRWPDDLDVAGSRFALIGAGASGFQIAPTIAGDVEQLTIYQRTAQWMFPNPVYRTTVPPGDRWALRHLPFYARWFRFLMTYPGIAAGTEQYRFDPGFAGNTVAVNETNARRGDLLKAWIMAGLRDRPDLIDKCMPDYPAMGKRILQDDGSWLQCLCQPNVELVRTGIDRIVPDGVVTVDGTHRRADVICYATGFKHNDFLAPMEVTGRNGISLRDQWGDEPTAYLGVTVPNFPNLFCLYGPGTNLAHSASLFFHSEFQTSHAMAAIHTVLASGARSIEVRRDVHDDYAERHQREISQLVWAHPSIRHSHYKNPAGKVYTLSPWPLDQYWEMTLALEPADYVVR
ncbi:MAG: putative flavoprotein involved in transport [Acidimicrobiales bacterium]|nr:putative flavoprotein involved in transport [Acidimicrobiales bacterium]